MTEKLEEYPHLRIAEEEDNEEILEFLKKASMNNQSFVIRYDRSPNYFFHHKEQAIKSYVLLMLNKDMSIGGTATFLLRMHYKDGLPIKMAYLADLRTSPTLFKRTRVEWRRFYEELVNHFHEAEEFEGCKYLYTAILKENHDAIRALTRKRSDLIYDEVADYKAVSLMARVPIYSNFLKIESGEGFTIKKANLSLRDKIIDFLIAENCTKPFGYYFSKDERDEFMRREKNWEDFDIKSFLVVQNRGNEIVGVVYPKSFSKSKKLICDRIPLFLRLLGKFITLFRDCKLEIGSEIKILYLTHLEICSNYKKEIREEILQKMLHYIYDNKIAKSYHIITYIDFNKNSLFNAVKGKGFLYQNTNVSLYQVMNRDCYEKGRNIMDLKENGTMGLEIGIA